MTIDWDPQEHMGRRAYSRFKNGEWVEVDSIPEWVREASDAPPKASIPANGSVDAVFTGNSLQYKVVTKRLPRGAGTYVEQDYYVQIRPDQ